MNTENTSLFDPVPADPRFWLKRPRGTWRGSITELVTAALGLKGYFVYKQLRSTVEIWALYQKQKAGFVEIDDHLRVVVRSKSFRRWAECNRTRLLTSRKSKRLAAKADNSELSNGRFGDRELPEVSKITRVVSIGEKLYVQTPEALKEAFDALEALGFTLEDLRNNERHSTLSGKVFSAGEMERNGHPLWSATINLTHGKCLWCGALIKQVGIHRHNRRCESCGRIVHKEFFDGQTMRFRFDTPDRPYGENRDIMLRIQRWDERDNCFYLYPEPMANKGIFGGSAAECREQLLLNRRYYEIVVEGNQPLIKIPYEYYGRERESLISIADRQPGGVSMGTTIEHWQWAEYSQFNCPIPSHISIYETWHYPQHEPSPTLHEKIMSAAGQVSRQDYYYQDGSKAFDTRVLVRMARFVRALTTLDADRFELLCGLREPTDANERRLRRFRLDGPGFIEDLAHFCHPDPKIRNEPNFWNSILAVHKGVSGLPLTQREIDSALSGAGDRETRRALGY